MIAFVISLFVCHAMAAPTTMSPHELLAHLQNIISKEVEVLWHNADTNHDGEFSVSDMNVIFVDYDHDKDNAITQSEFVGRFTHNEPDLNAVANGLFLELDVNRDGSITHHDLQQYYLRIDADNNGHVTHTEFKAYFEKVLTLLFVVQLQQSALTTVASG